MTEVKGAKNAKKHKRMTRQKQLVYDILCGSDSHPTADWIYARARVAMPGISLGTVYRNLQVLEAEGSIQELNYGKTHSHFDGRAELHYHFICEDCGSIFDLDDIVPLDFTCMEGKFPGVVRKHRMEIYGICNVCLNKIKSK